MPHPDPSALDSAERLSELKRLLVLDTAAEQAYDDITRMAAALCGTPIALISLVDENRQWFKSRIGLQAQETPREMAFCAHTVVAQAPLVVEDATQDARFVANPLVTGEPNIRFYAGAPLVTSTGQTLGTLCVIDTKPRHISAEQLAQLEFMARQVIAMLEKRAAKPG
jgi:GAF domain-containing protein